MGNRSILSLFFATLYVCCLASTLAAQDLESILASDTDDLRALIDLDPVDDETEKPATKSTTDDAKPIQNKAANTKAKQASNTSASANDSNDSRPIRSVLKQSRVVNDSQVKPATFGSAATPKTDTLKKPLEQLNKPAPLPTPKQISPIRNGAKSVAKNVDDTLFNFGVLVAGEQGGPVVRGVIVGSPAARAGIMAGDRIKSVGSQAVANPEQLATSLRASNGGRTLIKAERRGRDQIFQVTSARSFNGGTPAPNVNSIPRYARPANNGWRSSNYRAQAVPPTSAAQPVPEPQPQPAVTPLARPLGPSESGLSSRLAPALRSVLDRLAEPNLGPSATPQQRTQPSAATASLSDVPPPTPRPSAATQPLSGESVIRQQQARYAPRPGVNNQRIVQQGTIVRGQGGTAQRRQPVIGSGGRIIGKGRVINSFRRIFGR